MRKKGTKGLVLVASCLLMLGLSGCGKKTIDLNEYLEVEISGYNGYGTADVSFDSEKFYEDYEDMKFKDKDSGYYMIYNSAAQCIKREFIRVGTESKSGLSNGDTVKIEWDCKDETIKELTGYTVEYKDIQTKVDGLEVVPTFDGFAGVKVEFSGCGPDGTAKIVTDSVSEQVGKLQFQIDHAYGLSNGDVIKLQITNVKANDVASSVELLGAVPETLEKEIVVEGLSSYVISASEIDSAAINSIEQQAEDLYKQAWLNLEGSLDGLQGVTYVGNYFLIKKQGYRSNEQNQMYMVFKVDCSFDGVPYPHYAYVQFSNVAIDGSGNCVVDTSKFKLTENTYHPTDSWMFYYYGYGTIDDLYNDVVISKADGYISENNVKE